MCFTIRGQLWFRKEILSGQAPSLPGTLKQGRLCLQEATRRFSFPLLGRQHHPMLPSLHCLILFRVRGAGSSASWNPPWACHSLQPWGGVHLSRRGRKPPKLLFQSQQPQWHLRIPQLCLLQFPPPDHILPRDSFRLPDLYGENYNSVENAYVGFASIGVAVGIGIGIDAWE